MPRDGGVRARVVLGGQAQILVTEAAENNMDAEGAVEVGSVARVALRARAPRRCAVCARLGVLERRGAPGGGLGSTRGNKRA